MRNSMRALIVFLFIVLLGGLAWWMGERSVLQEYEKDCLYAMDYIDEGQYHRALKMAKRFTSEGYGQYAERIQDHMLEVAIAKQKEKNYTHADYMLYLLDNYKDAKERLQSNRYERAAEAQKRGDMDEACNLWLYLDGYKDSQELLNNYRYETATQQARDGKSSEALNLFELLEDYKDSRTRADALKEPVYKEACRLREQQRYAQARRLFGQLGSYNKSDVAFEKCTAAVKAVPIAKAQVGDLVTFGCFPQEEDGKMSLPIEWWILDDLDGNLVLLSRYGLYTRNFHVMREAVTWNDCELRKGLEIFYVTFFAPDEFKAIDACRLHNYPNPWSHLSGGCDTEDNVFLLSIDEAQTLLLSDLERRCQPTKFALANGAHVPESKDRLGCCEWWLRSPGATAVSAYAVNEYGHIGTGDNGRKGIFVDIDDVAVRPAMCISRSIAAKAAPHLAEPYGKH